MKETVDRLAEALKDEGYFYAWQANIAMQFKDEMARHPDKSIHENANNAAKRFLKLLMYVNGPD